ncbi:MAG TPA: hypothetical protein VGJ94_01660 [Syntrophorhabdaceae bacterium]
MGLTYIFWVALIGVSLWTSIGVFLWAHRNGQFRDQERARYLPLRGEAGPLHAQGRGSSREALVTAAILFMGVGSIITATIIAFMTLGVR